MNTVDRIQCHKHFFSISVFARNPFKMCGARWCSSYRQICLTSCVGKHSERLLKNRLNHILESNDILRSEQAGVRKLRLTQDQALKLTQEFADDLNKPPPGKPYNSLPHRLLERFRQCVASRSLHETDEDRLPKMPDQIDKIVLGRQEEKSSFRESK